MQNLLPGLRKFSEKIYPGHQALFETLSQGQQPHTLFITCSDSRIDPNLMTQTLPGELFVVRNAGNIVPPFGSSKGGEEAAIEFAIDGLGVKNVVVCGHSKCGAMAALADQANVDALPSVKTWLSHAASTKRRLTMPGAERHQCGISEFIDENVLVQVENLKTHPAVSAALRQGRVNIYGWVYNFESGTVRIYDPRSKRFVPSVEVKDENAADASRFAL